MIKETMFVKSLMNKITNDFTNELKEIAKVKNGICEFCKNTTCKRDKKTNRKECKNYIKEEN